jgi:hypothetical protein
MYLVRVREARSAAAFECPLVTGIDRCFPSISASSVLSVLAPDRLTAGAVSGSEHIRTRVTDYVIAVRRQPIENVTR